MLRAVAVSEDVGSTIAGQVCNPQIGSVMPLKAPVSYTTKRPSLDQSFNVFGPRLVQNGFF